MQPLCVLAQFDDSCAAAIRGMKAELCAQGVACDILPPHITLGIYENLAYERLARWCRAFAAQQGVVDVHMSHIGIFGSNVCFLAPRVDTPLLRLHEDFHAQYDSYCTGAGQTTSLQAGRWTPHCTLFQADMPDIQRTLPLAAGLFTPFTGRLTGLIAGRFVTDPAVFTPGDDLASYTFLGGKQDV